MHRWGLAGRITAIIVLVALSAASISGLLSLWIGKKQFAQYIEANSQQIIENYSRQTIAYYEEQGSLDGLQEYLFISRGFGAGGFRRGGQFNRGGGMHILVKDAKGKLVADSTGTLANTSITGMKEYAIQDAKGNLIATLYMTSPFQQGLASLENQFVKNLSRQGLISILLVSLLALAMGLILARGISGPLQRLSGGIHSLAQGKFSVRLAPYGDRELHQLMEDFNQMAQKLEDHQKNQQTLMASIAHELRTPLTLLRGQLEAVQTGRVEWSQELSSSLVDEIIRLTRLVKDLESIGQAENKALPLQIEQVRVEDILDGLAPLEMAMKDKGIRFTIDLSAGAAMIYADKNRIIQVLINLISNAMRYVGEKGEINLSITSQKQTIEFAVTDNGAGIDPGELPHIFDHFYRVDESRSRHGGGTGLGLAVARSFVQAHGGQISVVSQPGQGSRFFFSLPQPGNI